MQESNWSGLGLQQLWCKVHSPRKCRPIDAASSRAETMLAMNEEIVFWMIVAAILLGVGLGLGLIIVSGGSL